MVPSSRRGLTLFATILVAAVLFVPTANAASVQHRTLAPGTTWITLAIEGDSSQVTLGLAGSQDLVIQRVTTDSGLDIDFAGHSPQQASAYFRDHPFLGHGSTEVTIEIVNSLARDVPLTVSLR